MLGADDDWTGFEPRLPVLEEIRRRHPHVRLGRTGLVMEALVPAVIEQKVTGQEAFGGFRALVHRFGERAPGPGRERKLWVQPAPGDAAHDPVVGVAAAAHRPGPVADRGDRRQGRRLPRADGDHPVRRGGPSAALAARRRGVDERRGAPARVRRPRCRVLRRLPRGQGRRLGAHRHARSTTRSSRTSSSRGGRSAAGSRCWSGWAGCAARGTARGCRLPHPPTRRELSREPGHASAQSIGRSGRRISSVNRRCRSRASHSPWVSSMQLDWSSSQTFSSTWAMSRSMTSTLIS